MFPINAKKIKIKISSQPSIVKEYLFFFELKNNEMRIRNEMNFILDRVHEVI